MACRSGNFLSSDARDAIIKDLKGSGALDYETTPKEILNRAASLDASGHVMPDFGTGCLACGEDDDHANILLCEACNAEYHTYCLSPPLRAVPAGDWYCAQCKIPTFEDDGLDRLVNALPPAFTSRFGEVCWAQGGASFGWWPVCIYDPRLTVGSARQLARKNLGKRHLAYFFECHDAPFTCLIDAKLTKWEDGLLEDYHIGKTAKAAGKARIRLFQQAMQAAMLELGKPIELRMEFNHTDQPQILPSPKFKRPKRRVLSPTRNRRLEFEEQSDAKSKKRIKVRGFPLLSDTIQVNPEQNQVSTRKNLNRAIETLAATNLEVQKHSMIDMELCCTVLLKSNLEAPFTIKNIGFMKLKSRLNSTFEDARKVIEEEVDPFCIAANQEWRFYIPSLGPMSVLQESRLGPVFNFLRLSGCGSNLGDGSMTNPLKVMIVNFQQEASDKVSGISSPAGDA